MYKTSDSGRREKFGTGSVRDDNKGKPRFDLISPFALKRIADLMSRGAEKYGERNWELGQPQKRFEESGLRHFYQHLMGDKSEDHLSAICFNIMSIIHFEELKKINNEKKA